MKKRLCFQFATILLLIAPAASAQSPGSQPKTTDVLVILTVKPGVARERIVSVMPDEVRATVRLYLDGKIRQWYSRSDGKGVIFILDSKEVAEAQSIMEGLPLAKEKLADYEFIAMAPLAPLGALLSQTQRQ
jgi:hypothetical protein